MSNRDGTYCAIDRGGRAYCGGLNIYGTVGDGAPNARRGLAEVSGDQRWKDIHAGGYFSCGLTVEGKAFCWGQHAAGSLGNDSIPWGTVVPFPIEVSGGHEFTTMSKGLGFACGLTSTGQAMCWGEHSGRYLGVGDAITTPGSGTPLAVAGNLKFATLDLGYYNACAVTSSGDGYCWGRNVRGELGDGSKIDRGVPVRVVGTHRWRRIYPQNPFTCGVTTSGAVYCWGRNTKGQFGPGAPDEALTPFRVAPPWKYRDIAVGENHLCGVRFDYSAECWGEGEHGQLGNGTLNDSEWAVRVVR